MEKLITFNQSGQTILGTFVAEDDLTLTVKNPAILFVQPTTNGQLNVQTIPVYFREFIGEKHRAAGTIWKYSKAGLAIGLDIDNDPRLIKQYDALFGALPVTAPVAGDAKVIKLFDDK